MHGDDDGYSKDVFTYRESDMDRFIKELNFLRNIYEGDIYRESDLIKLVKVIGLCDDEDECWDYVSDILPRDMTNYDGRAVPSDFKITYFDSSGVERSVKLNPLQKVYTPQELRSIN